jgi:hypothetical protein
MAVAGMAAAPLKPARPAVIWQADPLGRSYTTQDVAALLASKDDSQGRSLRVDTNGIA